VRRLAPGLALLVAGLVLGGCNLVSTTPLANQADSAVPFDLLAPTLPFSPSQRVVYTHQSIYLLSSSGYLEAVPRLVPAPASLFDVEYSLPAGPNTAEASRGLGTRVPADAVVEGVQLDAGRVLVEMSSPFARVTGRSRTIAVAQLLESAAAWGPVSSLQVEVNHEPLSVLVGSTETTTVTLSDVRSLLAPTKSH
jgi:hypothetical protein